MASSRKAKNLKAKEAKQKKILAVGLVMLVGLMALQMPKLMHRGGNATAAPPITVPTSAVPGAVPTTLAPPEVASAVSSGGAAPADASGLADTDVSPTAASGQLVQFDLFDSKDPFVQQVKDPALNGGGSASPLPDSLSTPTAPAAGSGSAPASGSGAGSGTVSNSGSGSALTPDSGASAPAAPSEPMSAVARLTVNGTPEAVALKRAFPAIDPMFQLDSLAGSTIAISVVGGSYQDGAPSLKLERGRAVTLMNTVDGTKYRIVFVGLGKVATSSLAVPATVPAAASATAAAASTTGLTPTTTAATTPATTTTAAG